MSLARRVLVDTLTLGGAQVLVLGLTALQTLVAARHLGPQGFGVFALVVVLMTMAALGTPGFLGAAYRELPHLRSIGDTAAERRVFCHTVWGELGFASAWAAGIAAYALTRADAESTKLLLLAAGTVLPAKLYLLCQLRAYMEKDFRLQAGADMVRALVSATLVCSLVWTLDVRALLIAPLVANCAGVWRYRRHYHFDLGGSGRLQWAEFRRLARIGLPITGLNVVAGSTGLQNWGERLMLGGLVGTTAVGVYAFFGWIVLTVLGLFASLMQVLRPHLYELMSREFSVAERRRYLVLPTWAVSASAMIMLGGCAAVLPDLIRALLPQYAEGIAVMYLLLAATVASCMFWVPVIVINSARVDGQFSHFLTWCAAVLLSLAVDYLLLVAGAGLAGVACGYLLCQCIVLGMCMWRVKDHMFGGWRELAALFSSLALPAANAVAAALALIWLDPSTGAGLPSPAWPFLSAGIKGALFLVLCLPTLVVIERRTQILSAHLLPRWRGSHS